jgi:SUKH-4 immunity protein
MRTCSLSEFVSRWPGSLRPVVFPEPPPALPDDCRRLLSDFGLPRELTIYCYNDITMKFTGAATPFAAIFWDRDLKRGYKMGNMPAEWTRFWHLADGEYIQGGCWLCIEEMTGRLVVIDTNCREPLILLNSSVSNFYTTLAHFLDWSERTDGGPAETAILRDALLTQNCIPAKELEPFWMNFIYANLDYSTVDNPVNLTVSLGPRGSTRS